MRGTRVRRALTAWLLVMAAGGCVSATADRWGSREAARQRADARARGEGAWVSLSFEPSTAGRVMSGELIAVGADSLVLLVDGALVALPTATLRAARVEILEGAGPRPDANVSPLVLVRPAARRWRELVRFARFPQGLSAETERRLRDPAAAARDSGAADPRP